MLGAVILMSVPALAQPERRHGRARSGAIRATLRDVPCPGGQWLWVWDIGDRRSGHGDDWPDALVLDDKYIDGPIALRS
jgi:hypothetical protein